MALITRQPARTRRQARNYVPPLPHPSWRLGFALLEAGSRDPILSAQDFWARLG